MWGIWKARNNWVFNKIQEGPIGTLRQAHRIHVEYKNQQYLLDANIEDTIVIQPSLVIQWTQPPLGFTKINMDGAFDMGKGATRAIARDNAGASLGSLSIAFD